MAVHDFFTSRNNNANVHTYIGHTGRMFYDTDTGTLRLSDGVTPGGQPINLIGTFNDIALGNIIVDGTTIRPTAIDTDLILSSTGTGQLNLLGAVNIRADRNLLTVPTFSIGNDSVITAIVSGNTTTSAFNITGNLDGSSEPTNNPSVMVHVTGPANTPGRVYVDGAGTDGYAVYAGRKYNGVTSAPSAVLNNQLILRVGATPYTTSGWPSKTTSRVDFLANENQTGSSQGSRIEFVVTPNGSSTPATEAVIDGTGFLATNLTTTGRANITNRNVTTSVPVLTVSANADGLTRVPILAGTVAQFTPKDNQRGYILHDSYGIDPTFSTTSGQYVFRTARGTNASPIAVQTNDILGEIGGAGWGTSGYGGILAGSIKFVAAENFTDTNRGAKFIIGLVPVGSNTPVDVLTITPTSLVMNDGASVTGRLKATAGTTSDPSIQLTAGPLPTVPAPGAISYNGIALHGVPQDSEIGVILTEQVYVLNAVRNLTAGVTTAQSIFGKTVRLSANTRYYYRLKAQIFKNGSAANNPTLNYGLGLAGGATLFSHGYYCVSSVGTTGGAASEIRAVSSMSNYITTGFSTGVPVTAAAAVSSSYVSIEICGWINTNTAGTFDFQIAFSDPPNSSCSVQPTASIRIHPVSAAGADTSIGTWA